MTQYTVCQKIDVAPSTEGRVSLLSVKSAQTFRLKRFYVQCSTGSEFRLGLALYSGIRQVCPDEGLVYDDGAGVELTDDTVFPSGDEISLYYKNEDTAAAHSAFVMIEGEIES